MKRIALAILVGIALSLSIHAQDAIVYGTAVKSFDNTATTIANGTAFALPAQSVQCTWVTSFTVAPASITVLLQTSLDNSTYNTLDTSTAVGGETRNVVTSSVFIRARISASNMGSGATVSIICKQGLVSTNISPTFTNLTVTGTSTLNDVTITGTCTGCGGGLPSDPDTSVQFNDGGAFGGNAGFVFTKGTNTGRLDITGDGVGDFDGDTTLLNLSITGSEGVNLLLSNATAGVEHFSFLWVNNSGDLSITGDDAGAGKSIQIQSSGDIYLGGTHLDSSNNLTGVADTTLDGDLTFTGISGTGSIGNIFSLKELDIITASGAMSGDAGSNLVLTSGDGNGMGEGGNIYFNAGSSGSGKNGDILLSSSDWIMMLGPVLFGTNGSIATGVTAANNLILRAYDVDGAGYKTFLTLTSNNTPDMTIAPESGATITLQATTYKSSDGSTGATGAVCTSFKNGLCVAVM